MKKTTVNKVKNRQFRQNTGIFRFDRLSGNTAKSLILIILAAFLSLSNVHAQRNPIDINLIIDSSESLSGVKDEITAWVFQRFDDIMVEGDRVTVWSAGTQTRVIYSGSINNTEMETLKTRISEISPSGSNADFSIALREAGSRQQNSGYSYTLLISASLNPLSNIFSGPQANLLRFSKVEEISSWRVLTVGLNLETRVTRAAAAFFN